MALPEGVTTCTVTAGVPVSHTGAPVKAFLSIEPSVFLVHTATGTPLVDFLEELSINEGVAGQFTLPHTDQAGFQDENGNAYTNWYYTARITYSTPSKAKTKAPKIKVFQLATGQTLVDLDSLPGGAPALPYVAPIATVTSFHGRTGPVAIVDEDLPERLSEESLDETYLDRPTAALTYARTREFSALEGPQAVDKTGATNTYVALQAAIDAAAAQVINTERAVNNDTVFVPVSRSFYIPDGVYNVGTGLKIPQGITPIFAPNARLKATAAMPAVLYTDPAVLHQRKEISGGVIDCNGMAETAVSIGYGVAVAIRHMRIHDPKGDGIIIGDPAAPVSSYEMTIQDIDLYRPRATGPVAGKAGLWVRRCTDSVFETIVPRGFDIGTRAEYASSSNTFTDVHPWNPTGAAGPSICFDDASGLGNVYNNCYADTPSLYGWRISGNAGAISNPRVFLNGGGVDNTVTAFQIEEFPALSIIGAQVWGADVTHRIAKDVFAAKAGGLDNLTWIPALIQASTVVTRTFGSRPSLPGLTMRGNPAVAKLQANLGSVDAVQWFLAGGARGAGTNRYGMNYSAAYTTAARPTAVDAGIGSEYHDTTTNKRMYSDGANWRDAMGTIG